MGAVSGDKVSIEPGSRQSGRGDDADTGRSPRWLVGVAMVGAALVVGWLLRISATEAPASTSLAAPTTMGTPGGPATTVGLASGVIEDPGLADVPLGEAVPGFADTITALAWDNQGVDIMRWRTEQTVPETVVSLAHSGGSSNRGMDVSGRWFSEVWGNSVLAVHAVSERGSQPWLLEETGVRLWSAAWHDSQPGRLAWLACEAGSPGSSVILYSADIAAEAPPERMLRLYDVGCDDRDVWLARWGDWGMLLHRTGGSGTTQLLLNAEGWRVTEGRLDPEGEWFVGVGPGLRTIWTEGLGKGAASSFLLSRDGLDRMLVPGLVAGERLESALMSPDGSHLALVPDLAANYGSAVRIVDVEAGSVVAEITHPSSWVNGMVWSSDSRFLVYQRWPDTAPNRAGVPNDVELVFFDTEGRGGVMLPSSGYAPLLRSAG